MIYSLVILKRVIEDLFILPFVIWGRMKARRTPLNKAYDIYFFFPFYHTGGAEKVHAMITHALRDKKALIIFTRKSQDAAFRKVFEASGHDMIDISAYTDNKRRYWNNLIYRGVCSGHINTQDKPTVVFNGQSNFGYKLSRWIKPSIPQIELIHSFSSFSYIRVPFISFYRETVMISQRRIQDHINMYRRWGIPGSYDKRIRYICNGIPLPREKGEGRREKTELGFLFVGRGTQEKRPALAAAIVQHLQELGLPVSMTFVGDVEQAIPEALRGNSRFCGNISDPEELDRLYSAYGDVLLVTSSEEGFPLVVMEAMARGSVIMGTPVGDMPVHIQQGENGFLFSRADDEQTIIAEAAQFTRLLLNDQQLFVRMSEANISYAYETFGLANFERQYRQLIETYLH